MNYWMPLFLRIIKIVLYGIGQGIFILKAKRKEESRKFEILVSFFFLFMNLGSILEVFTQNYYPEFYYGDQYLFIIPISAEAWVYFLGFVGIGILTIGTELNVKLKSHGALSIIPFGLAIATLFLGVSITDYIYFLALIVSIVPLLYLYIAIKAPKGLKGKSYSVAFGYFFIFLGEAINYSIITRVYPFKIWTATLESIFGYSIAFLPPLIIIVGLILLFWGYKIS
ncbi:MAG: hypothetical protein GF329_04020 [Candidatus Lokiarchaeota archaeon]|nr:hypothetical protein [Candidatus Lokiarchaeota archaeon]